MSDQSRWASLGVDLLSCTLGETGLWLGWTVMNLPGGMETVGQGILGFCCAGWCGLGLLVTVPGTVARWRALGGPSGAWGGLVWQALGAAAALWLWLGA